MNPGGGHVIPLREVRFMEPLMRAMGLDVERLLRAADAPTDLFKGPCVGDLSLATFYRLWDVVSEQVRDETMTVSTRPLRPGTARLVLDGVREGMPLSRAMAHIAAGYNLVHNGDYNEVREQNGRVIYMIDDTAFTFTDALSREERHTVMESVLCFLHAVLCELSKETARCGVKRVDTRRNAGGHAFLTCIEAPVRTSAPNYAIHYDAGIAEAPVCDLDAHFGEDASIYRLVAQRFARAESGRETPFSWRERVAAILEAESVDQSRAARRLNVSVATLRRRLAEEDCGFRGVRAVVLNERAKRMLSSGRDVHEVAEALCYADLRSFSRAFKNANGVTPAAFRARPAEDLGVVRSEATPSGG